MNRSIVAAALVALSAAAVLTPAPARADATGDVRAAMLRFAGLNSYEMSVGAGGRTMMIDVVKPDAMRMSGGGMDMVRIGTTMYMKMPGAKTWTKMANTRGDAGGMQMAAKVRSLATDPQGLTVHDLGMRNVDGQNMHAYDVAQKDGDKEIIYIGGDGYVHRIDPKGKTSGGADAVRFSKFNAIPAIRAPI